MAQDIVSGLFGLSPSQVAQQQLQQTNVQAQNYAQLDPFQRASQSMYQAGAGLGGIGAGMLGMVNPEVEAAKQREATLNQVDMTTPEGILQGAELARQRGDVRMQVQLQALAEQRKSEMVDMDYKKAQTAALLAPKPDVTEKPQIQEVGVAGKPGWRQRAIIKPDGAAIPVGEPYLTTQGTQSIKIGLDQQKPKKFSARDEMRVQKASEAASAAVDARMLLETFEATLNKYKGRLGAAGTISGEANRWFGKDPSLVADFEAMQAWSSELGAKTLQLFGGSDTEKELEVAIRTNPSVDKTYAANQKVIRAKYAALAVAENLQPFQEEWLAENGSLLSKNNKGETFSTAWKKFQRENFKPEAFAVENKENKLPAGFTPL